MASFPLVLLAVVGIPVVLTKFRRTVVNVILFSRTLVSMRNALFSMLYSYILKPIFFLIDPEVIHNHFCHVGSLLGRFESTRAITQLLFGLPSRPLMAKNSSKSVQSFLQQSIGEDVFMYPIGLAAGFDKNCQIAPILSSLSFGHAEIGSITLRPYAGNAGKRLHRLIKAGSIVVNYGLKNEGVDAILPRIEAVAKDPDFCVGVSIARTNDGRSCGVQIGVDDYVECARRCTHTEDGALQSVETVDVPGELGKPKRKVLPSYFTINISCPNTVDGQPFEDPSNFKLLLDALSERVNWGGRSVFVKIGADLSSSVVDQIAQHCAEHSFVTGIICSNLTKAVRNNPGANPELQNIPIPGGLSGKPTRDRCKRLLSHIYKKYGDRFVLVGCGGIMSAEDAYECVQAGATLLQMISGMIFCGPQVVSDINIGLARLLARDGYSHISEAVGTKLYESRERW